MNINRVAHSPRSGHTSKSVNANFLLGIGLLLLTLTGCQKAVVQPEPESAEPGTTPPYTLDAGDKLRVNVYEHENLSGTFTVDDGGTISLPLIGRIRVSGMTVPEVETTVTGQLVRNHINDPRVSIDLLELRPFCVFGEVKTPGCYSYVYGMTASKAIAMAGGYTYRAKTDQLLIRRDDGKLVHGTNETRILAGDVIEVQERLF